MKGSFLGPEFTQKEIEEELNKFGAKFEVLNDEDLIEKVATDLSLGEAIGWFQGRMEFGPRGIRGKINFGRS
jgi:carbamoyltransferase